jgi:histidinol-phosphate aminotransferase
MNPVRIRPDIAAMEGYTFISGTYAALSERLGIPREQIIKLDTNENLYGPSPKALAALAALQGDYHIYPDVAMTDVRAALADYTGVGAEHILVGNGADELIDLVLRLFIEPGDTIIDCPPTFTMYSLTASWLGNCEVLKVPRHADFSLDVDAVAKAVEESDAKLLFVCNPNNPDGGLTSPETMQRLLELPVTVVVDEAYIEFSEFEGFAPWVTQTPNLIVMRTLSKWAGLAGLRVGYGIFPLEIIQHLWKIKHPFNVNIAADIMAQATLADIQTMQERIARILDERERLYGLLQDISYLEPLRSEGNYLLCRVTDRPTAELKQALDQRGILIRNYTRPGLESYVRISIGKPEHTDALIKALQELAQ